MFGLIWTSIDTFNIVLTYVLLKTIFLQIKPLYLCLAAILFPVQYLSPPNKVFFLDLF